MPLVQLTRVPTVRLCDVIVYWGGQSGENVTFPLNPAFAQVDCALLLRSPMRLTTLHVCGVGVGVGLEVGRGVGRGVGAGATTGFGVGATVGPGDGCALATGESEAGTVGDPSGDGTTTTAGADVRDGASVTSATVWSRVGPPRARTVPTSTITASAATMNGGAFEPESDRRRGRPLRSAEIAGAA
jgi:hypothetical protein